MGHQDDIVAHHDHLNGSVGLMLNVDNVSVGSLLDLLDKLVDIASESTNDLGVY